MEIFKCPNFGQNPMETCFPLLGRVESTFRAARHRII